MKTKLTAIVLLTMGTLSLASSPAEALDLLETYDAALHHDPMRLAADQALLAGQEKRIQGDALLKPRVDLQAGLSQNHDEVSVNAPPALASFFPSSSSGTLRQAGVQLVQPLYDPKAKANRAQLREQSQLADAQFKQASMDLMRRVSESYIGVLSAMEAVKVIQAQKQALALQLDRAQARFEVGRGKITEVQETQARYDQLLAREIQIRSALEMQQARFAELTGLQAQSLATLPEGWKPGIVQPDSLASWQDLGQDNSPQVKVYRSELEIARAEVDKSSLQSRPSLNLVASYAMQGQSGGLSPLVSANNAHTAMLGVQFNLPLYEGGAIDSRARESAARLGEAEDRLAAAQADLRLRVQDTYLTLKADNARVVAFEQSYRSAQTALDATLLGRDVGTRTQLDVLDAEQRLYSSEFDLVQSRLDSLLAGLQLNLAAGVLDEGVLHQFNAQLQTSH